MASSSLDSLSTHWMQSILVSCFVPGSPAGPRAYPSCWYGLYQQCWSYRPASSGREAGRNTSCRHATCIPSVTGHLWEAVKMLMGLEVSSRQVCTPEFPSKQWCLTKFSLFDHCLPNDAWHTLWDLHQSPKMYPLERLNPLWSLCRRPIQGQTRSSLKWPETSTSVKYEGKHEFSLK